MRGVLKNIMFVITLFFIFEPAMAEDYRATQVMRFTDYISKWTSTKNPDYRFEAEALCNGEKKTIVNDEFSHILTKRDDPNAPYQSSYELETYLNKIDKLINSNSLNIYYSDIAKIPNGDIASETKIAYKDLREMAFYSCKIKVTGVIQHESTELFYIYKDKIAKIAKLEKHNGKVVVDFDDFINDYETVGFSYNYGQHFPIGGSFNYSLEDIPFMISVDLGINLDGDKYVIDKVKMTDIMNYEREKRILDPKFFLTVTPQAYFKYFAIGCGVGFLYMDGTKETATYSSSSNSSSGTNTSTSISVSAGTQTSTNAYLLKPMIRPVVKGFIPVSDEISISVSVGYDLIFGYKEKNGFNAGLGIQWEL